MSGGLVVSFERMNRVLHLDVADHVAVVQPGLTLRELDERLAGTGLRYPVYPGELSGSLGGNVNTNAGGMRAVRHGVTRHHVVGPRARARRRDRRAHRGSGRQVLVGLRPHPAGHRLRREPWPS